MNEQTASQNNIFANMKKNKKLRTVAYSFACSYVQLRTRPRTFAVLWFLVQYAEKIKLI